MRTDRRWNRIYAAGWLVSAGVTLVAGRLWYSRLREMERRAEEAERTRDEVARRRAVEERLRIARELHDSLTHSISVIRVQSGVAAHLARKRGEEVPPAVAAIQEASADAARELRATLSVLRSGDGDHGSGLDQLADLVGRARTAGLAVTVTVTGAERRLPPEVDQAAYRIVQEALTNVSRHAGQACARVHLHFEPDALTVRVDNDASDAGQGVIRSVGNTADAGPDLGLGLGLGLIGMRERVAALGGRLDAGPREEGGFLVQAELPVRASS